MVEDNMITRQLKALAEMTGIDYSEFAALFESGALTQHNVYDNMEREPLNLRETDCCATCINFEGQAGPDKDYSHCKKYPKIKIDVEKICDNFLAWRKEEF